jgi:DNA-binding response OmpR family regulator
MSKKILIVEDDPGIQLSLIDEFESHGYVVFKTDNGETAIEIVENQKPDLIILDIMLPVLDGLEVCKRLRQTGNKIPIIMLTVKDKEIDRVLGLELGADDYVTKPFSLRELMARVKAIFRRTEDHFLELNHYHIGEVEIDFKKFEARKVDKKIEFTPFEFRILKLLIEKKGTVLSRNEILDLIWGADNLTVTSRTIDSHIANIRKKVEQDPAKPEFILSIRGMGYKLADI